MNCSILEPCYRPDCTSCTPPGSIPSNMKFARHAISQIMLAKLEAWRGRYPFPPDPNEPTRVLRCDLKRYNKW